MRCLPDQDAYPKSVRGGDGAAGLADMDLRLDQVAMVNLLARVRCKHGGSEVETRWSGVVVSIEGSGIPEASPEVRYGSILWAYYLVLRPTLSWIGSMADCSYARHTRDLLSSFC